MKLLSLESNLNNDRKSSIIKANIRTPTHTSSYLSFSNYFKKKKQFFEINKQFSKDFDISLINKKVNSFKISNTRKKKSFQTGILGKISLKKMEKSIRKKIIVSSKLIKSEAELDFGEDIIIKTPSFNNNSSNYGKSTTEKCKQIENDIEGLPYKNKSCININNNNFFQKSSIKNLINSNKNLSKITTDKSQKNLLSKISSKNININIPALIKEINYRKLVKTKILYDSFDECESGNENDEGGYYLSPQSLFIKIFDFLIIISNLFVISFNPYYISIMKYFCYPKPFLFKYIYFFVDILFIFDLLLGFWRSFYNQNYQLVKKARYIIRHYIATDFLFDLIQSFPFFSLIYFQCQQNENKNCTQYTMNTKQMLLIIFSSLKHLKFFKITNKKTNSIIFQLYELTNEKYLAEDFLNIFITFLLTFFCFFTLISIHIFIANQNYPNWIVSNNLMDKPIFVLYLNSFYFITTTITTVGYGDMIGSSLTETIFRIILLTVGISLYSWIVSNIGSYVDNESRISIRFNRDEAILEEIRISYPNMPYKLYNQILHHLEQRKLRQKKLDLNLLINSLPYSLRNTVLFAIHKQVISNFKIFKKCQNSDFINKLLTNFIPLFSKKNAILIYENQLIENLVFVKNGRLSLEAAIDIETPIRSINEYFNFKFIDIKENNNKMSLQLTSYNTFFNENIIEGEEELKVNDHSALKESIIEKEIGKCEFEGEEFEESNYQFINIINITKNESYGIVYMFLSKPSPLSLRVKSKKAELFLLRKSDAFSIAKRFPNIWKKQYKRSYINMHSIKKRTIKKLTDYCQIYGISFQVIETPELKKNLTIKEILEKAKQKEIMKSNNSISLSNIFKETENKSSSNTSKNKNSSNLKNGIVTTLATNVQSMNNNENTGTFGVNISNQSKNKNTIMSFSDKSPKINPIKNKRHSVATSKIRSEHMSKFKMLDLHENSSSKELPSFGKLVKMKSKTIINKTNKINDPHKLKKSNIVKLKKKIKKLKASKIYYKTLFKKVSDKLKENKKNNYINLTKEIIMSLYNYKSERQRKQTKYSGNGKDNNKILCDNEDNKKTKVINNVIVQNNNNYICSISDFISSESNKSSSSSDRKIEFSIEKTIDFSYNGEYMNLKELTKGEISQNSKFMKIIFSYIQDLYIKLKKEKQKKAIIEQIVINETADQSLGKKNKKIIKLFSDNFLPLSPIISKEDKNNKKKRTKNEGIESFSLIKNKKLNNLNFGELTKINPKLNHLNLNNYSVKINLDNSENNKSILSKGEVTDKSSNKFLSVNENSKFLGASILSKKLSNKKSFVAECEWDKKSYKNDPIINDNSLKDHNILNINESKEKKKLVALNSYNSNTEKKLKIKEHTNDFINIKNDYINKNGYKKDKSKKTKEKIVQDYEYCSIL